MRGWVSSVMAVLLVVGFGYKYWLFFEIIPVMPKELDLQL
jgi:hypothetical protein